MSEIEPGLNEMTKGGGRDTRSIKRTIQPLKQINARELVHNAIANGLEARPLSGSSDIA